MKTIYMGCSWIAMIVVFALSASSCRNDDKDLEAARLFKPYNLRVSTNQNGLIVKWNLSYGAKAYEIDLSGNEDFDPVEVSVTVPTTGEKEYQTEIKELSEDRRYYIRLRALLNGQSDLNSKYIYTEGVTGFMPTIFLPVGYEDMTYENATVRWTEDVGATQIVVLTSTDEEVEIRDLTASEIENMRATITGLSQGVKYRACFFVDGKLASYITFTMPRMPEGAILMTNADNLQDKIDATPLGGTLILTGGQTYDYSTTAINIVKAITIQATPGTTKPLVYLKQLVLGGEATTPITVGPVIVSGLEISGMARDVSVLDVFKEDSTAQPSDRAFFISARTDARTITIDSLAVDNCIFRNYAKAWFELDYQIHASSIVRIGAISANDIIAYDLGRNTGGVQSFIHVNSHGSANNVYCAKYLITNSTFYHLRHGLIEARWNTPVGTSVPLPQATISGCTFDRFGVPAPDVWQGTGNNGQRYWIDFSNYTTANGFPSGVTVKLEKSIFGEFNVDGSAFLRTTPITGATFSTVESVRTIDCNYTHSSFSSVTNTNVMANVAFPARAAYIYTIPPNVSISNAVGDPRWK